MQGLAGADKLNGRSRPRPLIVMAAAQPGILADRLNCSSLRHSLPILDYSDFESRMLYPLSSLVVFRLPAYLGYPA